MTKFRSQDRHRPELEMGIFDKVYNSFSVDFWLIAANLVVVTNWFMHPQSLGAISLEGDSHAVTKAPSYLQHLTL